MHTKGITKFWNYLIIFFFPALIRDETNFSKGIASG